MSKSETPTNKPESGLVPLTSLRRRIRLRAEMADWDGQFETARKLWRQLDRIDARIAAGELYEIPF